MIIVTGTKRSGTSLWMQILAAGGYEVLGEAFPRNWEQTIRSANPGGFYESKLTAGIYFGTNPDPVTGTYLFPEDVQSVGAKVFVPGLLKTERAFVDRCIATIRPWREYAASLHALRELTVDAEDLDESRRGATTLTPALEWWADNYALVRDIAVRRLPAHVQSYAGLLRDPERVIGRVFQWLGGGDVDRAARVVRPALHRNRQERLTPACPPEIPESCLETFDALYALIDNEEPLTDSFIGRLNATQERLRPVFLATQLRARRAFIDEMRGEVQGAA